MEDVTRGNANRSCLLVFCSKRMVCSEDSGFASFSQLLWAKKVHIWSWFIATYDIQNVYIIYSKQVRSCQLQEVCHFFPPGFSSFHAENTDLQGHVARVHGVHGIGRQIARTSKALRKADPGKVMFGRTPRTLWICNAMQCICSYINMNLKRNMYVYIYVSMTRYACMHGRM